MTSAEKDTRRVSESIDRMMPGALRAVLDGLLPAPVKDLVRSAIRSRPVQSLDRLLERRAERRLRQGKRVVPAAEIRAALDRLPLPDDAVVFVHSGLSRLGFVEGGVAAVAAALRGAVVEARGGTVAVPAFSMTAEAADIRRGGGVFDVRSTPSETGRIAELLRCAPDARRSLHPTHSVAAIGPRAAWLVADHHRDRRSFGPLSPFARLIEADGFVLGLGVDLGPVTFYHVIEDLGPFPIEVYTPQSPITATCRDERGALLEMQFMAHDPAVSANRIDKPAGAAIRAYITTVLEHAAGLSWHAVGDGRMWLIRARRFYDCLTQLTEHGVTIYASAEQVRGFPPPASLLPPPTSDRER